MSSIGISITLPLQSVNNLTEPMHAVPAITFFSTVSFFKDSQDLEL